MSSNRQSLRWYGTFSKKPGNTLLMVWPIVKMNPHKKAVFARTQHALNIDFVCWHGLFQQVLRQPFDNLLESLAALLDCPTTINSHGSFASVITNENDQALPVFFLCLGVVVGDQIADQELNVCLGRLIIHRNCVACHTRFLTFLSLNS